VTFPVMAVMLLFLVTALLVRSGELRLWHVIVTGLLGFFLARTDLAAPITATVVWIVTGLTHTN
jgi:hypothetical protein